MRDLLDWIAYERDAAWTAKLAILRAERLEDIAHFGACLREHDRHADELVRLARASDRRASVPTDATFVTDEPHLVGSLHGGRALLETMERVEAVRVDRYLARIPLASGESMTMLHGILQRHLADARGRLAALGRLREPRREAAA